MNTRGQKSTSGHFSAKWGSILFLAANTVFIGAFVLLMTCVDLSTDGGMPEKEDETLWVVITSSAMLVTSVQHVSLLMILSALFWSKFRAPWFYYATQVSSVFMFFSVGGPILAIVVSRYQHHNRAEFMRGETKMPPQFPVSPEETAPENSVIPSPVTDATDLAALLEENRRLKSLVADQALQLQDREAR